LVSPAQATSTRLSTCRPDREEDAAAAAIAAPPLHPVECVIWLEQSLLYASATPRNHCASRAKQIHSSDGNKSRCANPFVATVKTWDNNKTHSAINKLAVVSQRQAHDHTRNQWKGV
jgi:hypothetical protein